MSIYETSGPGADLGATTFADPDVLGHANANAHGGAFPPGELIAKQPDVDGLGKSGSTPLDASTIALAAEFNRLISRQKICPQLSNITPPSDQCLKN